MDIDTAALQTPKIETSEVRQKNPPLLIPPTSADSFQRSTTQAVPSAEESGLDVGVRRDCFVDLGGLSDNEFILLPPVTLPHLSIKTLYHPQSELDDCSVLDAMEVEAINYHVESSPKTEHTPALSRIVTLVEDSPSSAVTNRFRLPCLRLQPRTRGVGRDAPWESFHNISTEYTLRRAHEPAVNHRCD